MAKAAATAALAGLLAAGYLVVARPYQMQWGATAAEIARPMPGDTLSRHPTFLATRAITINGTPREIWPWLVQMGYGRAGFYGYDILENLGSPRGLRSAETVAADLQHLAVGDPLPLSAFGGLVVHTLVPEEYLVWAGSSGEYPGAFTWALYPLDARRTRLVSRIQWRHHWRPPLAFAFDAFTEFTDGIAVRKILQGVKDRVEGRHEPFAIQNAEFAIYVWTLLSLLAAIAALLWRPLAASIWLTALGAGCVWLLVWYAPIAMSTATLANAAVLWA
ncbi:MAG: hypothetical protein ABIX28_18550, partial [Vicinamibacterales bacterium]